VTFNFIGGCCFVEATGKGLRGASGGGVTRAAVVRLLSQPRSLALVAIVKRTESWLWLELPELPEGDGHGRSRNVTKMPLLWQLLFEISSGRANG
jgi:hypothetical protein